MPAAVVRTLFVLPASSVRYLRSKSKSDEIHIEDEAALKTATFVPSVVIPSCT